MRDDSPVPLVRPALDTDDVQRRDAETYHEHTKLNRLNNRPLGGRVSTILNDPALFRLMVQSRKAYPACERVQLPREGLGGMKLEDALFRRRSQTGRYGGKGISLEQLASILRGAYGPTRAMPIDGSPGELMYLRATPSAGGLYPAEVYPVVFDVAGLPAGVYHYDPQTNGLDVLDRLPAQELKAKVLPRIASHDFNEDIAVLFAITAVMPRTMAKYLFRGYRFLLYDVGALVQSLYLTATALGLGTCAVGGFFDDEVGEVLEIDNVEENVMLLFSVGEATPGLAAEKVHVPLDR